MEAQDASTTETDLASPPATLPPSTARSDRSIARVMEREDDQSVRDWLDSLGAHAAIKVVINRRKPMLGPNGEKIDGALETVEDKIDEEYIRESWGGGLFLLQVQTPKPNGGWKILRARTVNIGGPPKMNGQLLVLGQPLGGTPAAPIAADDHLAERAFNSMTDMAKEERARADRLQQQLSRPAPGLDLGAIQAFNQPLLTELAAAREMNAQLQSQLAAALNKPAPRDDFRDKLLERAVNDESTRVNSLREVYEQRIEKLRDMHADELKRAEERHEKAIQRLEDRHNDEIKRIETTHEREMRSMEKVGEMSTKSLDTANAARVESLKAENDRIARELSAAQTRIATLEAKKDQTLAEKAEEILKVKETIEGLGGDNEGGEEKWWEKAMDMLGNSEAALKFIDKIGNGPGQQMPQIPVPPPGQAVQGPDGNWYTNRGDGQLVMVDPRMVQQQRSMPAAAAAPPKKRRKGATPAQAAQEEADEAAVEQVQTPIKPPSAKEVKMAITFMENALKAGTDPVKFAQSARNLVPGDVLAFVQRVGVDQFMNKVVDPSSNLATIRGRQFARSVFAALVGDVTPAATGVVAQPANDEEPEDQDEDDEGDAIDAALDEDNLADEEDRP